jgi:hypothetical protein
MNTTSQPLCFMFSIHQSGMQNLLLNQIMPVRKRAIPPRPTPDSKNKHYVISLQARKRKTALAADRDQVHKHKIKNCLYRLAVFVLLQYRYIKDNEHMPTKHSFQHIYRNSSYGIQFKRFSFEWRVYMPLKTFWEWFELSIFSFSLAELTWAPHRILARRREPLGGTYEAENWYQ